MRRSGNWELVCAACGARGEETPEKEMKIGAGGCPVCKGYVKTDRSRGCPEIRYQYAYPGSRNHEWILVSIIDRRYYNESLAPFTLEVWRQYQNSFGAEEMAKLLGCEVSKVEKAMEELGLR